MGETDQKCHIGRREADHEPDTLEKILGKWMGQEKEPVNKADQKYRSSSSQEKEEQK